jgi:assimilatory nitrate reductase catalytic subunit
MLPQRGRDAFEMFDAARGGSLTVLSLFGVNPVRNADGGGTVAEALAKTPFLVVSDLFLTETATYATLVLPAKGALEKSGTTLNLAGDLLPVNAALQAPDGVLSDFEMLTGLASQLDVDPPSAPELDAVVIEHAARAPQEFGFGDARFAGASRATSTVGQAPAAKILSGGGTWLHDPTLASLQGAAPAPESVGASA